MRGAASRRLCAKQRYVHAPTLDRPWPNEVHSQAGQSGRALAQQSPPTSRASVTSALYRRLMLTT